MASKGLSSRDDGGRSRLAAGWPAPERPPLLAGGDVHVWLVPVRGPLAPPPDPVDLADDELARARAASSVAFRERFVRVRQALRRLLGAYLDRPPGSVALAVGDHGKPRLAGNSGRDLRFSVSHADEVALLAFSNGFSVGVDLDDLERGRHWRRLAPRCLSERERTELAKMAPARCPEAFMRAWIRKEAYTKALGDGFSYGFREVTVSLEGEVDGNLLLEDTRDPQATRRWRLVELAPGASLTGALCAQGGSRVVRCWRYPTRLPEEMKGWS